MNLKMKKTILLSSFLFLFAMGCTNRDGEIIDLINSVKKQNDDLKAQISALRKTTDSALVAVLKVNSNIIATDKKIDLIQADLKTLLAQIASLTTQMTSANADLVSLKAKIDLLQVKCAELVAQISNLNSSNNGEVTSIIINHNTLNGIAPVNKKITYGVYTSNISGKPKMWITQNLGAERPGVSVDEKNINSSGWYFQFNRKQGYQSDENTRIPNNTWNSYIQEDLNWQLSNDPCRLELGGKWRLPTMTEWSDERNTWNGEAFLSPMKIVSSAYLSSDGGRLSQWGISGNYWSSTQRSPSIGWYLGGGGPSYYDRYDSKSLAMSCRCVMDLE
jgi:hypothetical protein